MPIKNKEQINVGEGQEDNQDYEKEEYEDYEEEEDNYYDDYDDENVHYQSNINNNNINSSKKKESQSQTNNIICNNINSEILNNKNIFIIKQGLKAAYPNTKIKAIDLTIKFRASLDGASLKDFFSFNLFNKSLLLVIKTKNNQIFGAYGNFYKYEHGKKFYFNVSNQTLNTKNISLQIYQNEIYVHHHFRLGDSFFKEKNLFYENNRTKVFACREFEAFEINFAI